MFKQHHKEGQLHEAEEVLDVVFLPRNQSAVVLHPDTEPFHFPAAAVAAQWAIESVFESGPRHNVPYVALIAVLVGTVLSSAVQPAPTLHQ